MTTPTHYFLPLSNEERAMAELWAFNHRQERGLPMAIPPRLYEDLKSSGVDMRNFVNDPNNEERGNVEAIRAAARRAKENE